MYVQTKTAALSYKHGQYVIEQFNVAPLYKATNDGNAGHLSKDACLVAFKCKNLVCDPTSFTGNNIHKNAAKQSLKQCVAGQRFYVKKSLV